MAVTIKGYSHFPENALMNLLTNDLETATVKCALCTSSYTPDQDNDNDFADITNELGAGSGYTAGGDELTTRDVSISGRVTTFDADNAQWTSSTLTARYGIIYIDTGTPATSVLIAYVDFGEDKSSENGTFEIQWDASGIFTITVPA